MIQAHDIIELVRIAMLDWAVQMDDHGGAHTGLDYSHNVDHVLKEAVQTIDLFAQRPDNDDSNEEIQRDIEDRTYDAHKAVND
jgi:hypothetical protein